MKIERIIFFLLMIGARLAQADVIASWDVNGVDVADGTGIDEGVSPYAFTSSSTAIGIQTAKLQLGSAASPSIAADTYGVRGVSSPYATSLAEAISFQHYIEISISVASGYELNLNNIEMYGGSTSTGWDAVAFMSSVEGYTAGNELDTVAGISGVTGGWDTDVSGWGAPIDLSDAAYQGLTGTTTFRLYGWGATGSTGVSSIRNLSGDDLTINGSLSAVPEPFALSLIGIGGLLMLLVQRVSNA